MTVKEEVVCNHKRLELAWVLRFFADTPPVIPLIQGACRAPELHEGGVVSEEVLTWIAQQPRCDSCNECVCSCGYVSSSVERHKIPEWEPNALCNADREGLNLTLKLCDALSPVPLIHGACLEPDLHDCCARKARDEAEDWLDSQPMCHYCGGRVCSCGEAESFHGN